MLFFPEVTLWVLKARFREIGRDLRWKTFPGASAAEIVSCERSLGVSLPEDVRDFLIDSNGAVLEQHRDDELVPTQGTFLYFLNCTQIVQRTSEVRRFGIELDVPNVERFVCLVDYRDSNYVVLDAHQNPGRIIDGYHEEMQYWECAAPIAASFAEFADKVVDGLKRDHQMIYWIPP